MLHSSLEVCKLILSSKVCSAASSQYLPIFSNVGKYSKKYLSSSQYLPISSNFGKYPKLGAHLKVLQACAINKPRGSLNGLAGHHFIALRYRDNFLRSCCCLPPPTPPRATDNPLSSQLAASVYQTDHYVPSGASYLNPLMVIMENLYQPTH